MCSPATSTDSILQQKTSVIIFSKRHYPLSALGHNQGATSVFQLSGTDIGERHCLVASNKQPLLLPNPIDSGDMKRGISFFGWRQIVQHLPKLCIDCAEENTSTCQCQWGFNGEEEQSSGLEMIMPLVIFFAVGYHTSFFQRTELSTELQDKKVQTK